MTSVPSGAIDCDVHVSVPGMSSLLPYMSAAWREMIVTRGTDGLELASYPAGAPFSCRPDWRPANGKPGSDLSLLRRELLDRFAPRAAIVNCLYGGQAVHSEDLADPVVSLFRSWLISRFRVRAGLEAEPALVG